MTGVIVHEWIATTGGAEKVLDAMAATFPDADVLSLWNDDAERRYPGRVVRETWLARTPLRRSKAAALPLMPLTWRLLHGRYDWALVSSHAFAHHVRFRDARPDFRKYVYVHTPARYVWTPELDARGSGLLPRLAAPPLRALDRVRAREPFSLAANSAYVRERIRRTWGRDATVIHPPVDVSRITSVPEWSEVLDAADHQRLAALPPVFVLGASRFVPYKRLDLVIASGEAAGVPVVLAGSGPERTRLAALADGASVPVHVVDRPSDALLFALFQRAMCFVFPPVEDFGIIPVEAMAAGTPVLVCDEGGAQESVVDGVTGVVVHDWADVGRLGEAVRSAATLEAEACRARARDFGTDIFARRLRGWVATEEPDDAGPADGRD